MFALLHTLLPYSICRVTKKDQREAWKIEAENRNRGRERDREGEGEREKQQKMESILSDQSASVEELVEACIKAFGQ